MTHDPGRPLERTRLSWRRTLLGLAVVAGFIVRLALTRGVIGAVVAAVALSTWIALLATSRTWHSGPEHPASTIDRRAIPLAALVTVGFAGLGLILIGSALI